MIDYRDILEDGCGFVGFGITLSKNQRLLAKHIWNQENTDVSFQAFIEELDGLFISGRQGQALSDKDIEHKSYIMTATKNFLVDYLKALRNKKKFTRDVKSGKIESPEMHWAQLNADRKEARRMVDAIFEIIDDEEAELLLYKWGLRTREEIKAYYGGVSDTILSRRWKKLQAKLVSIKEEL
tara:strand:+ start:1767 stop:2312 length:546 start_codon:yes stop_codon:yes gene_type:complete